MSLLGNSWTGTDSDHEGPLIGHAWKNEEDDVHPIPPPDLRTQLDQLTDAERLELFSKYCKHCGNKVPYKCKCW